MQSLTLGRKFNQKLENLPNNLQTLTLGWKFNQKLENLHYGLQNLSLYCKSNQKLENLPSSLRKLTLHNCDNLECNLKSYIALPKLQKIIFKDFKHYIEIPPLFNTKIIFKRFNHNNTRKYDVIKKIHEKYGNYDISEWIYMFYKSIIE